MGRAAPVMTAQALRAATPHRRHRAAALRILRAPAPAPAMIAVLRAAPRVTAPAQALRVAAAPVIPAPARATAARPAAQAPALRATAAPAPRAAAAATKEGMGGYEEWDNTRLRRECAATETYISQGVAAEYIHFVNLNISSFEGRT